MGVRGGGAILLASILLSAFAPGASADDGVRVQINGGGTRFLSGPDVDAASDVPLDTPTTTRHSDGSETPGEVGGTSALRLVEELVHIPRQFIRAMVIPRTSLPGDVTLTGDQVRNGFTGDPAGSPRFATIYTGYGDHVRFYRPLIDGADTNARDDITTELHHDLVVRLTTTNDTVRQVAADADDATPDPGEGVNFGAHVSNPPPGVGFTYNWDFGDGETGDGQAPSHPFAAGHYRVTVTAVGDDGSSGVSSPIDVQVGKPAPARTPTATPSPRRPSGGSAQGGGGTRSGGGEAGKEQRASGPNRSRGRSERTQRAPKRDDPATPQPRQGSGDGSAGGAPGGASGSPAGGASPKPGRAAAPQPRQLPTAPTPASHGERVDGILLASAGSAADVLASVRAAEQERSPARRGGGGGGSVLAWFAGGGLLMALLGLGAVREGALRWRAGSA